MHEPASKKESAPEPSKAWRNQSARIVLTRLDAAELCVDVRAQAWVFGEVRKVLDDEDDGVQDSPRLANTCL